MGLWPKHVTICLYMWERERTVHSGKSKEKGYRNWMRSEERRVGKERK